MPIQLPVIINQVLANFDSPSWLLQTAGLYRTVYWVGGSGNWSDAANHWSYHSGGLPDPLAMPDANSNVVFDAASNPTAYTMTVDAQGACRDISFNGPASGALTIAGASITGALVINGSLAVVPGASITRTNAARWTLNSSSPQSILSSGVTWFGLAITGTGGCTLQDQLQVSIFDGLFLTANGPFDANGFNITGGVMNISGTSTVNFGGITINCSGGAAWTVAGGMSIIMPAQINVSVTTNASTFAGNGYTYNNLSCTDITTGSLIITGANTFANLTLSNGTNKFSSVLLGANQIVSGTFKYLANSILNRILLGSTVLGTQRTITAAAIDAASDFFDFQDINAAGTAAPFATGTSLGDCGGNSNITTTTPAAQTATGTASFTWSTHAWSGSPSRVPLPQDNVSIPNAFVAGRTITVDMPRMGKDIICTCTGSPLMSEVAGSTTLFGSFTLAAGMTTNFVGGVGLSFSGRGTHTITSNGVLLSSTNLNTLGFGGTYTLQDALSISCAGAGIGNGATLNTNGFSYTQTGGNFNVQGGGTLTLGSSLFTIQTPANVSVFTMGGTVNAGTSTIKLINNGAIASHQFNGGGKTYNNLWLSGTGPSPFFVLGANTFADVKVDKGLVVQMAGSVTNTMATFSPQGAAPSGDLRFGYQFGTSGSYFSTPDSVASSITGVIELIANITPPNWAIAGNIVTKRGNVTQISYAFLVNGSGGLTLIFSVDGTTAITVNSTVSTGFAAWAQRWVRVTRDPITGNVNFYTSTDPATTAPLSVTWVQLGATVAGTTGNLFDSTSAVEVGSVLAGTGQLLVGPFTRVTIASSIGGAAAVDFNPTSYTPAGNTWVSATGETWTMNGNVMVSATNLVGISSTTTAAGTVAKSGGGTIDADYLAIRLSTASPVNTWYAGANSLNEGGNTNWRFDARILSTGALIAGVATLAGAGEASWNATGVLVASSAAMSGAGIAAWVATGALVAGAAHAAGAGISQSVGIGDLDAQPSDLDGIGFVPLPPHIAGPMDGRAWYPSMVGNTQTPNKMIGVLQ